MLVGAGFMSKDTYYFSHDYNPRSDEKIKRLLSKHGYLGYGLYWAIIEDLYNNANALPTDYDCMAFDLRATSEQIKSILNDFDLFVIKAGFFSSNSVKRRMEQRELKSAKARESALNRWNKSDRNADALPPQSDSNAIKERKGKEKYNTEQFEIFWKKYPNKVAKKKCSDKFLKLKPEQVEKIMATIDAFVAHKPFPTYNHPNPETYLNQERWNDEVPADPSAPPPLKQKPADTSSWSEYDHLCWDVSYTPSLLKDYNCARDCLGNTTEAEKRGIYKRFFNQDTLELIDIFIKR